MEAGPTRPKQQRRLQPSDIYVIVENNIKGDLKEVCNGSCTNDCVEWWLLPAKNTLQLNGLDPNEYAAAIWNLLEKGRGKHRNIISVGNSNCWKTFSLKPLTKIYPSFTSPTS